MHLTRPEVEGRPQEEIARLAGIRLSRIQKLEDYDERTSILTTMHFSISLLKWVPGQSPIDQFRARLAHFRTLYHRRHQVRSSGFLGGLWIVALVCAAAVLVYLVVQATEGGRRGNTFSGPRRGNNRRSVTLGNQGWRVDMIFIAL
jgi:hypothetical protein